MEGTITVTITNQDPTTGAEELPVYAPPPAGGAPMPVDPVLLSTPGEPTAPGGPLTQDSQWALEAAGPAPQQPEPESPPASAPPPEAPASARQVWQDSYADAKNLELQTV